METIGEMIRRLRVQKGEPLRVLAAHLQIDQAVMSKIENGKRKISKEQVEKLAKYFGADKKEMLVAWMSDRIISEIGYDDLAKEALKVAEEKAKYHTTPKVSISKIKTAVKKAVKPYPMVTQVWLFGSFSRGEDTYKSDIDLMINVPGKEKFSMFDLFQIQHDVETAVKRKVDIVMKGAMKSWAWETAKHDCKLIYGK